MTYHIVLGIEVVHHLVRQEEERPIRYHPDEVGDGAFEEPPHPSCDTRMQSGQAMVDRIARPIKHIPSFLYILTAQSHAFLYW